MTVVRRIKLFGFLLLLLRTNLRAPTAEQAANNFVHQVGNKEGDQWKKRIPVRDNASPMQCERKKIKVQKKESIETKAIQMRKWHGHRVNCLVCISLIDPWELDS